MSKLTSWRTHLALALALAAACSSQQPSKAQPAAAIAWRIETVKAGLERPWSLRFAADGRLLFTGRNSATLSALDLKTNEVTILGKLSNVRVEGEAGLLGLELDPKFARNNKVYLCYSYYKDNFPAERNRRNRLSSFIVGKNGLEREQVLFDEMLGWWNHNGCRVLNGTDGKLYFSMGDAAGYPDELGFKRAQQLDVRAGKTFRLNYDGSVPKDNPFAGSAVWSLGHRNHQGLAFHPITKQLWSTEHGPDTRDELNIIKKGKNYGWPNCLGVSTECSVANYQPAVREYLRDGTLAMSGMAFYTSSSTSNNTSKAFAGWKNNLFFVTLKTGRIYRLELRGEQVVNEEILVDGDYGRLRDITMGPDGFLYFSSDSGNNSSIYRIRPQESTQK
jgi:aldose sugar dehydrogenase